MKYRIAINDSYSRSKKKCIRHGHCNECRLRHVNSKRLRPCEVSTNMKFILADDFIRIRSKYIEVIERTSNMSIYARWVYGQHPTDAMIQSYIDNNEMYMLMDKQSIAGMMAITMSQDKDYRDVEWKIELEDSEVAVIHILAVIPEYQQMGIGKRMIEEAISLAKQNGKKAVRLDALASNTPAHHMYERMGFEYRGKANLFAENTGWTDFFFFELILI